MTSEDDADCVYFGLFWHVIIVDSADDSQSQYVNDFLFSENIVTVLPGESLSINAQRAVNTDDLQGQQLQVCVSSFTDTFAKPLCRTVDTSAV